MSEPQRIPEPERQYYEKAEKEEEKNEKEREKEEKTWEEKWRRDPLGAIIWAVILMWAGVVLLADNLQMLARFGDFEPWGLILAGAGVIVLLEVILRLLVPSYRRPVGGSFIFAALLLGGGLQILTGKAIVWALVLIAIGVGILLRGVFRRG
jgi:hypothetical protein